MVRRRSETSHRMLTALGKPGFKNYRYRNCRRCLSTVDTQFAHYCEDVGVSYDIDLTAAMAQAARQR